MSSEPQKSKEAPASDGKKPDPLVGTVLDGRFLIQEVIGQGGMSVVYKAIQLRVNRPVAIKTMRLQLDTKPIYRERFQQEIDLLCTLSHPHIVTVYDCVIGEDDQPYVIMDYLSGRSLELLIDQDGPIALERCVGIAVQVCGALDHAHRKGVVHRDLKPGNIVLLDEETDVIKVVDFGLAKFNLDSRRLTQSGELWGSPPYMSPEHCAGKVEDERSDIYSFGCVLYEMLTGKDPFSYATTVYQLIQAHVNSPPLPISETNPLVHVPAKVEAVIFKAMEKEPKDRYQSALEFRDALVQACAGTNSGETGNMLLLQAQSKGRTQSGGESLPDDKIATTSEIFRRAMDPMQGMDIDQLFSETAPAVERQSGSSGSRSGNMQGTVPSGGNLKSPGDNNPQAAKATAAQPAVGSMRSAFQDRPAQVPNTSNIWKGLALVCLIFLGFVSMNVMRHNESAPPKVVPVGTTNGAATTATTGAVRDPAAASSTSPTTPASNQSKDSVGKETPPIIKTPEHPPPTAHALHIVPVAAHKHVVTKIHSAAIKHAPPTVTSPAHTASRSPNPWAALQGLRPKK